MNVLVFTNLYPNAVNPLHCVFIRQRVETLAKRPGVKIRVVAPVPYCPSWMPNSAWKDAARIPERELVGSIEVFHPRYWLIPKISMPWHGRLMAAGALELIRKLQQEARIDCIDAHYIYPDSFAAVKLGEKLNIPVCVSGRGTDMSLFPQFRTIRPLIRWTLEQADAVVAVSEASRKAMLEVAPNTDVRVIGNGIDCERFYPVPQQEARQKLKIAIEERMLLCVAALVPVKNHARLLRSFERLRDVANTRLYIIGGGPLREELERLAGDLRIAEKVRFVGRVANEDLKDWYSAADVSCLASDREGWPNVLSESLGCGTPAVATNAGGCAEVISNPELGIVVDFEEEQLASALRMALLRTWDRARIAKHAAKRTWDVVASEVEENLRRAIGRRKGEMCKAADAAVKSAAI